MKEFSFDISAEDLSKGLYNSARVPTNAKRLEQCINMRPFEGGLEEFITPTTCIASATLVAQGETYFFPFPQMYFGKENVLVGGATGVFEVNTTPTIGSWTVTRIVTTPPYGIWQFAEMGESWIGTNAGRVAWWDGTTGYTSTKLVQACCFQAGRVYMGGFTDGTAYGHWGSDLHTNSVAWTSIGAGDYAWPFQTASIDADLLQTAYERNEFGFGNIQANCTVLAMLPIGHKDVIVYTDNGIFLLTMMVQPVAGMGIRKLADVGVAGRGCMVGDRQMHHFIAGDGSLWRITEQEGAVNLGYENSFSRMSVYGYSTAIGVLDPMKNDRYFAVNGVGFCITPTGVGETGYYHSALGRWQGTLVGLTRKGASGDIIQVKTGKMNFGFSGIKTLQQIAATYDNIGVVAGSPTLTTAAQANVSYRYTNAAFSDSGYKNFNDHGVVTPIVSGHEFKCCIKGSAATSRHLDSIQCRWKPSDKRFTRGI